MNKIFLFFTLITSSLAQCMDHRGYFNTIQAKPWLLFQDAKTRRDRAQAFAMALHPRLGADSAARLLPRELVHEITITAMISDWLEQNHDEIETARMMEQNEKDNALIEETRTNNLDRVRILLYTGANVHAADDDGCTPLHWASIEGHTGIVRALLAVPGIAFNVRNNRNYTPAHFATLGGHAEIVKIFIALPGINVNATDRQGATPLHDAAQRGHVEITRALLAYPEINVNATDAYGYTPLHDAAQRGHVEIATALLAHLEINVNVANAYGYTPLHDAAERGHVEIVTALIAAGAEIAGKDTRGMTAANVARSEGLDTLADLIEQWEPPHAAGEIAEPANDILEEPAPASETAIDARSTTLEQEVDIAPQPAQPSRIMSIATNPLTITAATATAAVAFTLYRYTHR